MLWVSTSIIKIGKSQMQAARERKQLQVLTPEQDRLVRQLAKITPPLTLHGRRNAIVVPDGFEKDI